MTEDSGQCASLDIVVMYCSLKENRLKLRGKERMEQRKKRLEMKEREK
jgi:hypothetical protein